MYSLSYLEYGRRFKHFCHKGGDTSHLTVTSSNTSKDCIPDSNLSLTTGNKAADLSHENTHSYLANICGFSSHVWTSNDLEPGFSFTENCIIWDELHTILHFDTRMSASLQDNLPTCNINVLFETL